MPNIVVCADGTWNRPSDATNVWKLFSLFPGETQDVPGTTVIGQHQRRDSPQQIAFYLQGVGTRFDHADPMAGAVGTGLHDKVLDGYLLLSQVYERGDRIYLFGFSRGAFTARSLAGFIANVGLLPRTEASKPRSRRLANDLWWDFKEKRPFTGTKPVPPDTGLDTIITLVGVWDTVGALGIPFFNGVQFFDDLERKYFDFADHDLHPRVANGRHAVAIDEKRQDFLPTLWHSRDDIVERWFAGVHCDVGGGYKSRELADITLKWMLGEAQALGLEPRDPDCFAPEILPDAFRHESCVSFWLLRRQRRVVVPNADLDQSVLDRFTARKDYRPKPLEKHDRCAGFYTGGSIKEAVLKKIEDEPAAQFDPLGPGLSVKVMVSSERWWNGTGISVKAGERYRIEAQGTWRDAYKPCDADGWAGFGLVAGARRLPGYNWFHLCLAVSSNKRLECKNFDWWQGQRSTADEDAVSDIEPVGRAREVLIKRDGAMYLFANDAPFAYFNNHGSIEATITRIP